MRGARQRGRAAQTGTTFVLSPLSVAPTLPGYDRYPDDLLLTWLVLGVPLTLPLRMARTLLFAHQFVHERLSSARPQQVKVTAFLAAYAPLLLVAPLASLTTLTTIARLRVSVPTTLLAEPPSPDPHVLPASFHVLVTLLGAH